MAKIAFVKVFNGMYLGPAQLMGELHRGGHQSKSIFFKQYKHNNVEELDGYEITRFSSVGYFFDEGEMVRKFWDSYKPIKDIEIKTLIKELEEFNPDAIGFPVLSGIIEESAEVSRRLKEHFNVPIIWGGPGPTLEPEKCIQYADVICINEGEKVIVEFADKLDAKDDITHIDGTWAKNPDGEIIQNPGRPTLELDDIAIPDWHKENYSFVNLNKVEKNIYPKLLDNQYYIMTQRGCPFSCSFCIESRYQEMYGKHKSLRRRNVDVVIEELKYAKENYPIVSVQFYDDVFTINPRWLKEFLPRYKEEIGLPFWCYTYPNTHNPEILEWLVDAGLVTITMGLQHGSARVLKDHFHRQCDMDQVISSTKEITDRGDVTCFIDILTKIPMETEDDLRETFDFLLRMPKEVILNGFSETIAYPTYSYENKIKEFTNRIDTHNESDEIKPSPGVGLTEDDYLYYHRLHILTRTNLPVEEIRAIGNDPKYRENPKLLDKIIADTNFRAKPIFLDDVIRDAGFAHKANQEIKAISDQTNTA